MKNNTIEIKLTSYGTLEVVTIPVKLYKDSYKVVKLRVNALDVDNSMLKFYTSDRDEAGEQVWTSATYSLNYKEKVVLNGVSYNVYEDYLPQEICSKEGDVNITFSQVVENDEVEQIITSGTLNLYIGGEGFNYAGVKLSDDDSLAIKINKILQNPTEYDLVIKTQGDFDAFITNIENNTMTAKSVLFVGDGGNLQFVKEVSSTIILPETLKRIDGINNPVIRFVSNFSHHPILQYNYSQEKAAEYSMSNIKFIAEAADDRVMLRVLKGFNNLYNIEVETIDGKHIDTDMYQFGSLEYCNNIINCRVYGNTEFGETAISYIYCKNIINCYGSIYTWCDFIENSEARMFTICNNLTNCFVEHNSEKPRALFHVCSYLTNCRDGGSSAQRISFQACKYLTNCFAVDNFSQCHYLSNCSTTKGTFRDNNKFIWATQEDLQNIDADVTVDKVSNVLEDSETIVKNVSGDKIKFELDAEVQSKLAKTLITPMSRPTKTELVAVDNTNSQKMIEIGDGLLLENGTLKSTGKGVDVVQSTGSSTSAVMSQYAVTNQINSLSNRIDNIGTGGSSVPVVDALTSQSTTSALSARQGNVLYNMVVDSGLAINQAELNAQKHILIGGDGVLQGNVYNFTIQNPNSYIDYRTNLTKFLVDLHLPIVGDVDKTKQVAITFGNTTYYVFNILKGNERATIKELQQVDKYNNDIGYRFIAEMTFFNNSDLVGFAIIPTISMSDILSLDSDQMDNYIADGGLTQGQLATCSKVINNGYDLGATYRFDIVYPNTYSWTKISYSKEDIDKTIGNIEALLSEV